MLVHVVTVKVLKNAEICLHNAHMYLVFAAQTLRHRCVRHALMTQAGTAWLR